MILLILLLFLMLLPLTAHAKGGSTQSVNAVGPKNPNLIDLENKFYGVANPLIDAYSKPLSGGQFGEGVSTSGIQGLRISNNGVPQPYDGNTLMGQLFNDATSKTYAANGRYDDLMGQAPGLLDQARTAGDPWYAKADGAYGKANDLIGMAKSNLEYSSKANQFYDGYAQDMLGKSKTLLETGQIPQPIMDAIQAAMNANVNSSVGSNLNNLAKRGVINSSVTNKGISDMSRAVTDSTHAGYLDAFKTMLGGYNDSAATAGTTGKNLADTYMSINSSANDTARTAIGLGDSYGKTGSMRTGDLLGVFDANLKERAALMDDVSKYYVNAAAPMMPAYDLLKTMQQDHWNSDKKDTIVKQGK